jgi:hypothetical protein
MKSATLSNAQSLRVIGQYLRGLSIDAFDLDKIGDEYVVWIDRNQSNDKSSTAMALSKNIRKMNLENQEIAPRLHLHGSEIFRLDIERRLRRAQAGGMPDVRSLSLSLRVLGQYLDSKGADDFTISWSTDSVKVRFLQQEQSFSPSNLYGLTMCMYLRRFDAARQADVPNRLSI